MTPEVREQIALFRYKVISPILAEPARVQNDYLSQQAQQVHKVPNGTVRTYSVAAMKAWLSKYRKDGFEGLMPKPRADLGRPRRLTEEQMAAIKAKCKAFPHYKIAMIHKMLVEQGQLGEPPLTYSSLIRIIKKEDWLPKQERKDIRKRFELDAANELWVGDFMHGPAVKVGKSSRKAILFAVIDDHSRYIVGHAFSAHETVSVLTVVLKEAFCTNGIPKRFYVDNGPSFSSDLLASSCARAGISLIHSKPYDSPSRGKIERFFRTVRDRFLAAHGQPGETIEELNQAFIIWLRDEYHMRDHRGIDEKPLERYQRSCAKVNIRRLSRHELDEIFLVRHERNVNNDSTLQFKGKVYEVPTAYIRQRVELRHPVDDPDELWLYDNGTKVAKLKLVNANENARIFKPACDNSSMSFAKGIVKK